MKKKKNYIKKIFQNRKKLSPQSTKEHIKEFYDYYLVKLYDRLETHHIFLFSSSLAFSVFICIIPIVLLLFWLLGIFLTGYTVENQIHTFITTIIPYPEYAEYVNEIIDERIDELIDYKNVAGWIGVVGLFFAGSTLFSSIRVVLNKINGTDIDVNFFLGKLRDLALIIFMLIGFIFIAILFPFLDLLRNFSEQVAELAFLQYGIFQRVFTTLFSGIIIFSIFWLIYNFVPSVKIKKKSVTVGALWAVLLWILAKEIFGIYVFDFANFGRVYGTYAIIVVLAFWIYYSALVFILGAEIGKLYDERVAEKLLQRKR